MMGIQRWHDRYRVIPHDRPEQCPTNPVQVGYTYMARTSRKHALELLFSAGHECDGNGSVLGVLV